MLAQQLITPLESPARAAYKADTEVRVAGGNHGQAANSSARCLHDGIECFGSPQ